MREIADAVWSMVLVWSVCGQWSTCELRAGFELCVCGCGHPIAALLPQKALPGLDLWQASSKKKKKLLLPHQGPPQADLGIFGAMAIWERLQLCPMRYQIKSHNLGCVVRAIWRVSASAKHSKVSASAPAPAPQHCTPQTQTAVSDAYLAPCRRPPKGVCHLQQFSFQPSTVL